jgi:hypothetical protein
MGCQWRAYFVHIGSQYGWLEVLGILLWGRRLLFFWSGLSQKQSLVGTDSAGYGGRWPSVVKVGSTFYMCVTKDYLTDSHIVLYTSHDGIRFDFVKEVVQPEPGLRNQNPNLFYNKKSKKWYLYYYRGNDKDLYQIIARCSGDITSLDQAEEKIVLVDKNDEIIASPSMFYWKGKYYLLTETLAENKEDWRTLAWVSNHPESGFVELKNSPLPEFIHACAFQHFLNNDLVITYSYQLAAHPEWKWDLRITQAVADPTS